MEMENEYRVEIDQNNVTLGNFISYCKSTCKYKNIPFNFNKDKFIIGNGDYVRYYDGLENKQRKYIAHVHSEGPYKYIEYRKCRDGSIYFEAYSFEPTSEDKRLGNASFTISYSPKKHL